MGNQSLLSGDGKKIRVGMDISQLAHQGGVAIYTQNLAEQLSKFEDLEMIFFYSSLRKSYQQAVSELRSSDYKGNLKNVKTYRLPPTIFELFFNRIRNISIERFLGPLDIFHSSDWTQPKSLAKKVTTVHDLVPIKYPNWSHPRIVEVHRRRIKLVEKEIDFVIAVSESTKKDLMQLTKIPSEKIRVIYEGPSADFKKRSKKEIENFKKKYNLPQNFILAIGGIGERRNLQRIQEASEGFNLIITGRDIPWLNLDELELLLNSASLLIYCSLYEGFGLPILDAFSCGLPVVTSKISSMPELGGEAALYVDPYSVEDIKRKLRLVMRDKHLREDLIRRGFEQVKKFSWKKNAEETRLVYKNCLK